MSDPLLPVTLWDNVAEGLLFLGAVAIAWVFLRYAVQALERYRATFVVTATANLHELFLFVDPKRVYVAHVSLIVLAAAITAIAFRNWMGAVPGALAAWALPAMVYRHLTARRLKRLERQLPDALSLFAGSLRAGSSFNVALEQLIEEQPAPISQEFELFLREQRLGVDTDVALQRMARRIPLPDFQMVVAGMRISRETGGNLANVLQSLAETLRRKAIMESKIVALTAQGKMQGVVMSLLPVLLATVLYVMEPDAMGLLFTTPTGWMVLAGCAFLEVLGYFSIRQITHIDV
ncbi:MAG TPA: type II secretion system F family protein [Burkholderiales bacterium]|nr:type II secretion system F family protein [Burkholderiales bacterium]